MTNEEVKEFKAIVLEETGGGVYLLGGRPDGRCNTYCIACRSNIYLSYLPDKSQEEIPMFYKLCDCNLSLRPQPEEVKNESISQH